MCGQCFYFAKRAVIIVTFLCANRFSKWTMFHTSPGRWLGINMGNCLKTPTADDISLLRGSDSPTEGTDTSTLGPPPPYQVNFLYLFVTWPCILPFVGVVLVLLITEIKTSVFYTLVSLYIYGDYAWFWILINQSYMPKCAFKLMFSNCETWVYMHYTLMHMGDEHPWLTSIIS